MQSSVQVPDQFAAASGTETEAEVAWWERYSDPVLADLIQRAARENRDVKIAAERVRAARAGETISRSWLLPSFGAAGSRNDQRTNFSGPAPGSCSRWGERHGEPASEGFRKIRVHDLKHTFGRRLRAAGVSFEDRQDLLGQKSGRITTHYSQAELSNLLVAAEKVCEAGESRKSPAVSWLRRRQSAVSACVLSGT